MHYKTYTYMKEIIIIILLILLNEVFSMSEIALISARKSKLASEAKRGSKTAAAALKLSNEPDRFLSTIQIGITLIGILTGLYSGDTLAKNLGDIFVTWGMSGSYAYGIAQVLIVIIVTYLSIVVGELVPKRIGLNLADGAARVVARPMQMLSVIAMPFVWLLSKSTALLVSILGIKDAENKVTEEEIKSMIQEGTESGEVQEVEQDIMERVFVLGDQRVSSIMTNRKDIVCMDISMTVEEIRKVITDELHEAYPVIAGNMDDVRGFVTLKDLILTLNKEDFDFASVVSPAVYFPENMTVYKALEGLRTQKVSRALVCDEFGSLQGVITLRDILEGLVGSIDDAQDQPYIVPRHDNKSWLVDGMCPFYDFLAHFEREDLYRPSDYATVGGLVLNLLEHIPVAGEQVEWNGFTLEVVDMDGARIDKLLVTKKEPEQPAE